uniref:Uncharacterized protein n=1 Tax=Kalanchoe fedtschenkoi TaxID=63787 RepID=A0A7N0SZG8_KALFE
MADGSEASDSAAACARCGKPAKLQCPKCLELKLPRQSSAFWFVFSSSVRFSSVTFLYVMSVPLGEEEDVNKLM